MALAKNLFFVFLFHHLLLLVVVDSRKCPKSFDCGHLGKLEFPLSNVSDCGLLIIKGCDSPSPTLHFTQGAKEYWYNFLGNESPNRFLLSDPHLQNNLTENNCFPFKNLSLPPQSPGISFTLITPRNLTLFKCPNLTPTEVKYYHFLKYKLGECLSGADSSNPNSTVYYRNSDTDESSFPSSCSVIQLPVKSTPNSDDLSEEFIVEWSPSEDCYKCYLGGGQCFTDNMNKFNCKKENRKFGKILLIGAVGVGVAALSATSLLLFVFLRKKYTLVLKWPILQKIQQDIDLFFKNNGNLAVRRYRYSDLKKMTKSFRDKLGQGGFGSVYKGKLSDGRLVAVKILHESKEDGQGFMNELASMSRTSHINIVTLLGFCFEGTKRALVYEFIPNGSLEKYIVNTPTSSSAVLGWNKLFDIAVGIARGLEYLHQGCTMRILHFDIKPHNILLDKEFNPKISDFGLAKLCPNRSSFVSMLVARGTIGYIAPELVCRNYQVSHKSDVYSYGMMILEMAGKRKGIDRGDVDHTSEMYFPQYVYRQLDEMDDGIASASESESQNTKKKLIIVGLWCIQTNPEHRPLMTKVVKMLEGKLETLQIPKLHLFSPPQISTFESMQQHFTTLSD